MYDDISVIYNTCDRYESLWNGFFTQFKKYWNSYSGDVFFNTETKDFSFEGINIIQVKNKNTDCSWSQRIINVLDIVKTPYVILILDDFYFKSPVDTKVICQCVDRMNSDKKIMLYTFSWQPGPNKVDPDNPSFEKRGRFSPYRVNAQIGLWRVSYLKKILRTYENPWQFELSGSFRSSVYGGRIYSLKKSAPLVFDYDWGFLIIRGQLNHNVSDYFVQNEGLDMNLPFESYDAKNRIEDMSRGRIKRKMCYFKDMIISLFCK